jgi:hypothetical protein
LGGQKNPEWASLLFSESGWDRFQTVCKFYDEILISKLPIVKYINENAWKREKREGASLRVISRHSFLLKPSGRKQKHMRQNIKSESGGSFALLGELGEGGPTVRAE